MIFVAGVCVCEGAHGPNNEDFFVVTVYWYNGYNFNIPTTDRRGITWMHLTQHNLHNALVANCQSISGYDSTPHRLRCTDYQSSHNAEPQNDLLLLLIDDPPKGDTEGSRQAQYVRILQLPDGV